MELGSNYYKKWFLNYVSIYGHDPEIIIKRDHSIRVAHHMKEMFSSFGLEDDYQLLGDFIGLYHDIGRFEQWKQYHTFYDQNSVDHADFSVEQLFKDNKIQNILSERNYDLIIYSAVKYHNKLQLPLKYSIKDESVFNSNRTLKQYVQNYKKYLSEYQSIHNLYCMAIRDIDKIDILYQYFTSTYLLKANELPVSKKVASDFLTNQPIKKEDRKNVNDSLLLRLAFINDMNLTYSLKLLRDGNYIDKIKEVYPCLEPVREYFDYANRRLDELIEKNKNTQYVLKK